MTYRPMHLDPKALEAADNAFVAAEDQPVHAAIRAYLSASIPAEIGELVERLNGVYRIPITDGLGPVGGEEPNNPNEFVRTFETPPIQKEAASALRALSVRNGELERAMHEAMDIYQADEKVQISEAMFMVLWSVLHKGGNGNG